MATAKTRKRAAAQTNSQPKKAQSRAKTTPAPKPIVTLAVDIGGTGTKTMKLAENGESISERVRDETPQPATPRSGSGAIRSRRSWFRPATTSSLRKTGWRASGAT